MAMRSKNGRFLPGHPASNKSNGELIPHPVYEGKDHKGRFAPGNLYQSVYSEMQRYRDVLHQAVNDDDIKAVFKELVKLCLPGEHTPAIQLQAAALVLPYLVGRPQQEMRIQQEHTNTVNLNMNTIPNDDLKAIEIILSKTQKEIVIEPETVEGA